MKILIVDDDLLVLRSLNRILTRRGYEVRSFSSHSAALIVAETWAEVALLDVDMPERSGPELAKLFPPSLPVVFHTGNPRGVPGGAWFIEKPAPIARIIDALAVAIEAGGGS